MDNIHKILASGFLSYLLTEKPNSDICAYIVNEILPPPVVCIVNPQRIFFGVPEIDNIIGGLQGLWEIHGKKLSGKTYLCSLLARNSNDKVMYVNISGALCAEFQEINPQKIDVSLQYNLKSLILFLYSLSKGCEYSLIIIEGVSALLFTQEDIELSKELESIIKRLSCKHTVIVTCAVNDTGNLIGNYLWNDSITNNLYVSRLPESLLQVVWYKYNIHIMQVPLIY